LIVGRKDLVRSVAIGTHRGLLRPLPDGQPCTLCWYDTNGWPLCPFDSIRNFCPLAAAARIGNILVIHRRLGVVSRQNLVRAAVAVLAVGRGPVPALLALECRLC